MISEFSTNLLSYFADVKLFVKSAYYAIYDIDGGTGKMISNLNEPDASRYFLNVMNERTSFCVVYALILRFLVGRLIGVHF